MTKKLSATLAGLAIVLLGLSGAPASAAPTLVPLENPVNLNGKHVYDPTDRLGTGVNQVTSSIEAAKNQNLSIYVTVVDSFSNYSPSDWTEATIKSSALPKDSYLLAIASEDRQYFAASTTGSKIDTSATNDLATQIVAPQLAGGNYAEAVSSFAQQVQQLAMSGGNQGNTKTGDTNSTSRWFIIILLIAMIAAVALAIALYRRSAGDRLTDDDIDFAALDAADLVHEDEPTGDSEEVTPREDYASATTSEPFIPAATVTSEPDILSTDPATATIESPEREYSESYDYTLTAVAPASIATELAESEQPSLPEISEADYSRAADALHELGATIFSAEEDLDATRLLLGSAAAPELSSQILASTDEYRRLATQLDTAEITAPMTDTIAAAAATAKQHLKVQMAQAASSRYAPQQVNAAMSHLTKSWNAGRKAWGEANKQVAALVGANPGLNLQHLQANVNHAKRLLQASYKAIVAGQEQVKANADNQALKYLRAAERALTQTRHINDAVGSTKELIEHSYHELSAAETELRGFIQALPEGYSSPELVMAERALDAAGKTQQGQSSSLVALTQIYDAQTNLYKANQIELDAKQANRHYMARLDHVTRLLDLERLNLRLRRKFADPYLQHHISNSQRLLALAREKVATEPQSALKILNSCAEMLIRLDSEIPAEFPSKS